MGGKRKSVRQLAVEASLDADDALITLWDADFHQVIGPDDFIGTGDLNRARRALGLGTRRELKDPSYWCRVLNLDEHALASLLIDLGAPTDGRGRKLSGRSISRLRVEARRREIDPITRRRSAPMLAVSAPMFALTDWRTIGRSRENIRLLTTAEVLGIHAALADDFQQTADPVSPVGPRSGDLLASAVYRPETSNGGVLKYPTVEMAAAALLHSLVHDHPFHNGNKRTALVAMLVMLDENGFVPTCNEDDLFKLVLQVAKHRIFDSAFRLDADNEVLAISTWLSRNVRPIESGERPMPFRRLRQTLAEHGCDFTFPNGVGNRINISRVVEEKRFLGLIRTRRTLRTQIFYGSENRDVERNTLKKIREDLQLDDSHGCDSRQFYQPAAERLTEFILRYRKTLKRLARM